MNKLLYETILAGALYCALVKRTETLCQHLHVKAKVCVEYLMSNSCCVFITGTRFNPPSPAFKGKLVIISFFLWYVVGYLVFENTMQMSVAK